MKLNAALYKTTIRGAWLLMPFVAFPQTDQLSLKPGLYVREPLECKDAPNAAILLWDGVGFSGAHSSKCTSRLVSQHGKQFHVKTACSALGDGTPDSSGYVDNVWLTRLSNTRFTLRKESGPEGSYRWCSANQNE